MCYSMHIIFCGKFSIDSFLKLLVVVSSVIPEVSICFDIIQIPESELAQQCIMNKLENLFLFRRLITKNFLKKIQ